MEGPNSRVIRLKPQGSPTIWEDHCSVPQWCIRQVEFLLIARFELPLSVPQNLEIMPMQMPRVNLTIPHL